MTSIDINFLPLDYLVITLIIIITIISFWKGFINSILGILTWVGSIFITIYLYSYISNFLFETLIKLNFLSSFEQFVSIISILITIPLIFLISLFLLKRVRKILSSDLDKQIFGLIIDKFFGAIYGILFSYIIFSTLLYLTYNSNLSFLNNTYIFLVDNSSLLKHVFEINENIFSIYRSNSLDD